MGIFDALGGALGPNITGAASPGLYLGANMANQALQGGLANVNQLYGGTAFPYLQNAYLGGALPPLQNVYQTGQAGTTQLENLLGIPTGAGGTGVGSPAMQSALQYLQNTPGYQFTKTQGEGAREAAAAASGMLGSGNLPKALADYTSGLASQTFQQDVGNLAPFTNLFQGGANAIGNLFTGLGTQGANIFTGQAQQGSPFYQGMANVGQWLGGGLSNLNEQQGVLNALLGSNLVSGALGLAGGAGSRLFSDPRLKDNATPVGKLFDGQNIWRFTYKGDATPRLGLMADEVAAHVPDAVTTHPSGYRMVDYARATRPASALAAVMAA